MNLGYFFRRGVVLFLLSLSIAAYSQQSVSGYVFDKTSNKPISDANVLLLPVSRGSVTDADGRFEIRNIKPGKYVISVSVVGFRTEKLNVRVNSGKDISLNIRLSSENRSLGEVSVVGEGAEQRILNNLVAEPVSLKASSSIITVEDISNLGAGTLVDAMKYLPGALIESRGRKIKQFFSVRGQTYPYPTYSINGVWQKEFYETTYFLNSGNIQEIKIDRSASALLKSLSPLAGVIDVVSRKFDKRETDISLKYGSLNSFNAGVIHGNSTEKFQYSTGIQLFGTNGHDYRNGHERIMNINGDIGWKINDKINTSVKLFFMDGNRELMQPVAPAAAKLKNQKEKYTPLTTFMISSKTEYRPNETYSGELQVNYSYRNPKYFVENLKTGDRDSYYEKDNELTINQLNAWKLSSANVFRFGLLYNHWVSPNGKRYYYGNPADVHTWSAVITDQQRWGKWLVDGGVRISQEYYKQWGGFGIEGSGGKFTKVKPITNEWQSPVWQASAGVTHTVGTLISVHGNMSAGIVTPRTGAIKDSGNRPENEKRTNIEAGIIKEFHNSGSLTVNGFLVSRRDAIDYSGKTLELDNGDIIELYTNRNKRNFGVEIDAKTLLLKWLYMFANITAMKGEIKGTKDWTKDDETPLFIANIGCNVQKSRFDFNLFVNYTGAYKNNRFVDKTYLKQFGKAPLGEFFNVDITSGYTLGSNKKIRLFIEVKNLFNEPFQTVPGYPDYGTILSMGVKMKL